jgi:hypothetical protein
MRISKSILLLVVAAMVVALAGCKHDGGESKANNNNAAGQKGLRLERAEEVGSLVSCSFGLSTIAFFKGDDFAFEMSLVNNDSDKEKLSNKNLIDSFISSINDFYEKNVKLVRYEEWVSGGEDSRNPECRKFFFENGDCIVWNYRTWETTVESGGHDGYQGLSSTPTKEALEPQKDNRRMRSIYIHTETTSININLENMKAYYYDWQEMGGNYSREKLDDGDYRVIFLAENKIDEFYSSIEECEVEKWEGDYFSEPTNGYREIEINYGDGETKTIRCDDSGPPHFERLVKAVRDLTGVYFLKLRPRNS